jgi:aminoglycoside phosphotransferase (APT) family kinase protein
VLKTSPADGRALANECAALAAAADVDAPWRVPEPISRGFLPGTGEAFLVTTDLGGQTLMDCYGIGRCDRSHVTAVMVGVLKHLHTIVGAGCGWCHSAARAAPQVWTTRLFEDLAASLRTHDSSELAAAVPRAASAALSICPDTAAVLCHGDLHWANVLTATAPDGCEAIGVVDFEDACWGPPEQDIAKLIVMDDRIEPAIIARTLELYGTRRVVPQAVVGWMIYHALQGWLYGWLREQRHRDLWEARAQRAMRLSTELQR